jgi:hypothetical protein
MLVDAASCFTGRLHSERLVTDTPLPNSPVVFIPRFSEFSSCNGQNTGKVRKYILWVALVVEKMKDLSRQQPKLTVVKNPSTPYK